jgi:glycosyltransferase involved in cell wall biosynthesis
MLPVVNVRAAAAGMGGVRRYTLELCARLSGQVDLIAPRAAMTGLSGHLWEQLVLPLRVGGRVLWSPANVGPLAVSRQVVTIHDAAVFDRPEGFSPAYVRWYRALLPRLVRRVARVIVGSEFARERVIATMSAPEERVVVIHDGVAVPEAAVDDSTASMTLDRYGLTRNAYVLAVGTLEPRKNLGTLLEAWARVVSRLPDEMRLVVVGAEGSARVFGTRAALPATRGVVRTGAVTEAELDALYAGATTFVTVSLYEGFGLPPLEAAARGVPVIASDIAVFSEVLGDAATFVDPRDPTAIGDAILDLVSNGGRRRQLRELGLLNAKRFSWDRAARQTLDVLRNA